MLIRPPADIPPSEITPQPVYLARRQFLHRLAAGALIGGLGISGCEAASAPRGLPLAAQSRHPASTDETPTAYETITTYGNFYEFGPDKDDPGKLAPRLLRPRPWQVRIEGAVKRPLTFDIEDILKLAPLEERIYRLRCVEGWSMVVPWIGFPLSALIQRCDITGDARFVEFVTLADPAQMPYVRVPFLDWPYHEAVRLDEAMHPLAILAVGLYGEVLPNQNGAPLRVVFPWKYGFKGAKSIVAVRFHEQQPATVWTRASGGEYGFYANVNPTVDHPRWSQANERRLGEFFKRKTLMFNGYGEQVASLYAGMDLRRHY